MLQIPNAMEIAKIAHQNQLRKYTHEPYIVHPMAVAGLVKAVSNRKKLIVSAILHDILEDTNISEKVLYNSFDKTSIDIVKELTCPEYPNTNRKERQELELYRLSGISDGAKLIKLADIIDNVKTILLYDKDFSSVYIPEKRKQIKILTISRYSPLYYGGLTLYNIANNLLK